MSSDTMACQYINVDISAPVCRICSSNPGSGHTELFYNPQAPPTRHRNVPYNAFIWLRLKVKSISCEPPQLQGLPQRNMVTCVLHMFQ